MKKIIVVVIVLAVAVGAFFLLSESDDGAGVVDVAVAPVVVDKGVCVVQTKAAGRKLLEPMVPNNTVLSFETGADCHILPRLKAGSVVLYKSPRGPDPITLKVAGMPGDAVSLGTGNSLMVNGVEFLNSAGEAYTLNASDQRKQINKIKAANGGVIADGFYFLMGDNDKIYLDSSRFGLGAGSDILGLLAE